MRYLKNLSHILLLLLLIGCKEQEKTKKPNIIIILADDLGYAGLSSFGGEGIATPNLDSLAINGAKCTNFYANSTVCSPTRVALLSGRYQQRVGLDHIYFHCVDTVGFDPQNNPSLPVLLKNAGYKTGVFGKWHLGSGPNYQPKVHGFDQFVGFLDGNIDFISKHNTESEVDWFVNHQPANPDGYVTDLLNEAVVDFIEKEHENPFFIYLPEAAVHVPMQGPNDPALRTDDYYTYKVDNLYPKDEYMRRYSEMVSAMDKGIGMIMNTLRKYQLEENTLIIFTSDNGGEPTGVRYGEVNGEHRGHKVQLYEGGIKVPTLFYWKGKIHAQIKDGKMLTMDILPTVLNMANIQYSNEKEPDGVSLYDYIVNNEPLPERDLFWVHGEKMAMQRGDFKLVWLCSGIELYNLTNDPLESKDLSNDSTYQCVMDEMKQACLKWKDETAVGFPAQREIGKKVITVWPCKRNLATFNKGKKFTWKNGKAVIE